MHAPMHMLLCRCCGVDAAVNILFFHQAKAFKTGIVCPSKHPHFSSIISKFPTLVFADSLVLIVTIG